MKNGQRTMVICRILKSYCISNMNFLIADVIKVLSGTKITFSEGHAIKTKSKQFSEFGPRTIEDILGWFFDFQWN